MIININNSSSIIISSSIGNNINADNTDITAACYRTSL